MIVPAHVYKPLNDPPSLWDKILVHPMDFAVGLISVWFGVVTILAVIIDGFIPSPALEAIAPAIVFAVSTSLLLGGTTSLVGLFWNGDNLSTGWDLERVGWLMSTGGFISYSISVSMLYPFSVFSWGVPAGLALGCLLRFWAVVKLERNTRLMIAEVKDKLI